MKFRIAGFALILAVALAGCQSAQSTPPPAAQPTAAVAQAPAAVQVTAPAPSAQATAQVPQSAQSAPDIASTPRATLTPLTFKTTNGGDAVASVNSVPIKLTDFTKYANQIRASFANSGADPTSADGQQELKQQYSDLLDSLIIQELVRQSARTQNVTVSDSEVKTQIDQITQRQGGPEGLAKALAAQGLTQDDLTALIKDRLLANKIGDSITKDVPTTGEQVHARHILVKTEDEAKKVQDRLAKGEAFDAVAKDVSIDPSGKSNGGDLGWFSRGQMVPEFEQAAFSLAVGKVSDPVKSQFGYHIIQVTEKDANRQLSQDDLDRAKEQKIGEWIDQQKKAAKIEKYLSLD